MYTFTRPSYSSHTIPSTSWDTATISNMGNMIIVGLPKLRVLRQNLSIRSVPPRANRVRDKTTQRVASNWHTQRPSEGTRHPQALFLSPVSEVSFMPLHVDWHLAIRVVPPGITQESCLKPFGPDMTGGGISLCLVLWRGACPFWLSPMNGDPGSTQILTRHHSAKSLTISQLVNYAY
jgi:hypothetical protein